MWYDGSSLTIMFSLLNNLIELAPRPHYIHLVTVTAHIILTSSKANNIRAAKKFVLSPDNHCWVGG